MEYAWMTKERKRIILDALLRENWHWEDKAEIALRKGDIEKCCSLMGRADEVHRTYLLLKES